MTPQADTSNRMREPQRTRGKQRVKLLLDAAEALLSIAQDVDISLAMIAEKADVPLPSVYHFFRNRDSVLIALAQRYHTHLAAFAGVPLDPPPETWQDIVCRRQSMGVAFLNKHPAALRLFMGAGVSVEVRTLDLRGNETLSQRRTDEFQYWFDCAHIPKLKLHLALSIGLADGIWAISWTQTGLITPDYLRESQRASIAYLRCYLPEYLPHKS
ncbi:MAG: TetR/AcrR family transcriptional regulator [Gemmobacter sp.]|nr:TetR/AcrR family transcriptional regulator [Gemmobacter sp.]